MLPRQKGGQANDFLRLTGLKLYPISELKISPYKCGHEKCPFREKR